MSCAFLRMSCHGSTFKLVMEKHLLCTIGEVKETFRNLLLEFKINKVSQIINQSSRDTECSPNWVRHVCFTRKAIVRIVVLGDYPIISRSNSRRAPSAVRKTWCKSTSFSLLRITRNCPRTPNKRHFHVFPSVFDRQSFNLIMKLLWRLLQWKNERIFREFLSCQLTSSNWSREDTCDRDISAR